MYPRRAQAQENAEGHFCFPGSGRALQNQLWSNRFASTLAQAVAKQIGSTQMWVWTPEL